MCFVQRNVLVRFRSISSRKIHLPFLGVDRFTTPGDQPFAVHEAAGMRIGMNICYDGGFPESSRVLTLLGALQIFGTVQVLTNGGPGYLTEVPTLRIYKEGFQFHRFGYGSTLAIVLFGIVALLTLAQWQLRRRFVFQEQ